MAEWNQKTFTEACQAVMQKAHEDAAFRKRASADPAKAISEVSGMEVPEGFQIRIVDPSAAHLTLTLPPLAADEGELTQTELAQVAGGKGNSASQAEGFFDGLANGLTGGAFPQAGNSTTQAVGQGIGGTVMLGANIVGLGMAFK